MVTGREVYTSTELRTKYLNFFLDKGHKVITSASLFPENDPSVLFTTAGMHPLVPYLLGEKHPFGKRLVDYQKCIRTGDIDEVGDATHLTYFEMLGNWSLGDYFKKESITMSYEFLTSVLKIPIDKIAVTVFEGDDQFAKDIESYELWRSLGIKEEQIYFYGKNENWWGPAGQTGPCGPDTEIFYDTGKEKCSETCGPSCGCGKFIEIWNNVFMEYNKLPDGSYIYLKQKNVDTGMGLERILAVINEKESVYETDVLKPIVSKIESITGSPYNVKNEREYRIICDHMRAITFILGDYKAIVPSNSEQGYILRRLIRRTIRMFKKLGIMENKLPEIADTVIELNEAVYPELTVNKSFIREQLIKEFTLFNKTLDSGLKIAEKYINQLSEGEILSGESAFKLYDTFGFPIEFTQEIAKENGFEVDLKGFRKSFSEHQEKSRTGAEGRFKGGLADNSEQTAKLHTATHLLNGALRKVLGDSVYQKGSNINAERLRFDFSFDRKLTAEELDKVSAIVNEAIQKRIDIKCEETTVQEAKEQGAIGVFDSKYSDIVKVYTIEGYSKEICGGPHAVNTSELKQFRILKEESSSAGVRRIKAVIG
ncbi:alanine--tRNA ligase [Anaerocolumna sp. MB42-C2]|uniref:alanine--tRNA ligase n=1 Tax=Anaerocolumna sp. MB42-C2 TaxID=3070997 RepID=UPI0027E0E087|nr:alanine--tRNA ligase [Anaerocolumna sp. MB42-C2]WMJ86532.1 alanine--tRNA ligase [Anaerocolumna sp. MB42-C2]